MPIYAEKICDMRTLLKYAKNAAICKICGNRILGKNWQAYPMCKPKSLLS